MHEAPLLHHFRSSCLTGSDSSHHWSDQSCSGSDLLPCPCSRGAMGALSGPPGNTSTCRAIKVNPLSKADSGWWVYASPFLPTNRSPAQWSYHQSAAESNGLIRTACLCSLFLLLLHCPPLIPAPRGNTPSKAPLTWAFVSDTALWGTQLKYQGCDALFSSNAYKNT